MLGDAAEGLDRAGDLAVPAVERNALFILLRVRRLLAEDGRYWLVEAAPEMAGVVFQSLARYPAMVGGMAREAAGAAAAAVAALAPDPPGVGAEAATESRFAAGLDWAACRTGDARRRLRRLPAG